MAPAAGPDSAAGADSRLQREALIADPSLAGLALCRAYSDLVDEWLAGLFGASGAPAGVALVAVGGYGRAELSPESDIDLVLLHEPKVDVGAVADHIWYPIWDSGLKLGHAVRTIKGALALASDDLDTATSLLSVRHLAGEVALTNELHAKAHALWRKRAKRWLADIDRRVRERHDAAGEVAFLLEPDLKEGRGGLRDVHAIHWAELAESVMLEGDDRALGAAYDVLLSTRVELHRRTGRPGDRLLLQEQDGVAEALGYADANELMRAVSTAARAIAWTSDELWGRIRSSLTGPSQIRLRRDKVLASGVVLREGAVQITADADPTTDPLLGLRVAVAAAAEDVRIERATLDRLATVGFPDPFPWADEARQLFADLFFAGPGAIRVIEALDQRGLWVQLVPEWEPVRCKPQRNAYHTYTVDRHLCEAAVNASALVDRVDRPDLLVVGTLFHDIGKGYPGDHTVVGIEVVERIGTRMGFTPEDIAVLQDMVRHHLLLPDVATRRDITDDGTIEHVASAAGNERTLRLLWALTEADSLATGPAAWNGWKAGLVSELVARTSHVLGGGSITEVTFETFPTDEQLERMAERQQIIDCLDNRLVVISPDRPGLFSRVAGVLALSGLDVLDAAAYTNDDRMALEMFHVESTASPVIAWDRVVRDLELALTGRLALAARLEERARVYNRPRSLPHGPITARVEFDTELSRHSTVVEVHAPDAIGVLYRITRAISELELDIRSAKVQTVGAEVIDSFYVRDGAGEKPTDPALLKELSRAILHALNA
jgi:[protein-PII] uridylyltransferase